MLEDWFGEDPFETLRRLQREMDRVMSQLSGPSKNALKKLGGLQRTPMADITIEGDYVIVRLDMPGLRKEDIEISVSPTVLEVSAHKKSEKEEKGKNFFRKERYYTGYHRTINLPEEIKTTGVDAEYDNGVLTVKLQRIKKKTEPKKIKVNIK